MRQQFEAPVPYWKETLVLIGLVLAALAIGIAVSMVLFPSSYKIRAERFYNLPTSYRDHPPALSCPPNILHIGMSEAELRSACGEPDKLNKNLTEFNHAKGIYEPYPDIWAYGGNRIFIYVVDGKVSRWELVR